MQRSLIVIGRPKKKSNVTISDNTYVCLCCGKVYTKQEGNFFKSTYSKLWVYNNKYFPVCKVCLDSMFQELSNRYKSEKIALMIICHYLDIPFYHSVYDSYIANNASFSIGLYSRQVINNKQYTSRTFANTLLDGELLKTESEVKEEREAKWSKSDRQNMNFAISVVGYDPFDNCGMTDADRRYCFNILAGYCDCDGIKEDGHKIQSVIQITQLQLQCRKLDEMINEELLAAHPDSNRIKTLTATKKDILSSITAIAKDNNLASAYNKNSSRGANTLSQKMKEIEADGFEPIKVNLFDIKTCGAIKQIADISNQSILEQLSLDSNDYTQMLKEQRELIEKYRSAAEALEEENRMLKNKIVDLEQPKKR